MSLSGAEVPRWAKGVRLHEDAARGRWVILAPERVFEPDETALVVLRLVDGRRSVDAIVDTLIQRFGAPRPVIAADVLALFDDLVERKVLAA
ncbi:MAG: pyrroloquinoline quinone biosynthesis peptide chaperone PqqD [Acetobacteraceae bacterium]